MKPAWTRVAVSGVSADRRQAFVAVDAAHRAGMKPPQMAASRSCPSSDGEQPGKRGDGGDRQRQRDRRRAAHGQLLRRRLAAQMNSIFSIA